MTRPIPLKKTIPVFIVVLLVAVVIIFYVALSNKTDVVTDKDPYRTIIGKPLVTARKTMIINNVTIASQKPEYAKQLVDQDMNIDTSQIAYRSIAAGSVIEFSKALHFTNAVSGSRYAILLGTVKPKDSTTELPIMYHWGTFKSICIDEPCNYWEYETAPWEVRRE